MCYHTHMFRSLRRHLPHKVFEFNQITDQIFLGTNFCCQTHFDRLLLKRGVTCDISLEYERLDQPFGVEVFVWIPTQDHHVTSKDELIIGAATLDRMIKQGKKVYIHCKNGHGRAPTFLAAYFVLHKGMTPARAFEFIHDHRPEAHPSKQQMKSIQALVRGR